MAGRLRSGLPLLRRASAAGNPSSFERSAATKAVLCPTIYNTECARSYASAAPAKEQNVKVPLKLFGASGNYATALYIAAVKTNTLDKVEAELLSLVEASKKSPTFSQFMRDVSVSKDTRVKALTDICEQAKFSDITKHFLLVAADNGRLRIVERITERFSKLTMAHRGEVQAIVTSVIPLPPDEEKQLKETLQEILGKGTTVKVEQKVDPNILGGLIVEFDEKVFDMSIRTRAAQMERFLRQPLSLDVN